MYPCVLKTCVDLLYGGIQEYYYYFPVTDRVVGIFFLSNE